MTVKELREELSFRDDKDEVYVMENQIDFGTREIVISSNCHRSVGISRKWDKLDNVGFIVLEFSTYFDPEVKR